MGPIGVVVNPTAGYHRRHPEVSARLSRRVGSQGLVAESRSLEETEEIARRFFDAGIEILAISGGDGSLTHTLTPFRRVYGETPLPQIVTLRGGTMNTIPNGIGVVRRRPEAILDRLLDARDSGAALVTRRIGTVEANGQVGFLALLGSPPKFLREYYRRGNPHPTPWTAVETLVTLASSALIGGTLSRWVTEPVRLGIEVDGLEWLEVPRIALGAATVPEVGLGFAPFYRYDEDPTRFHFLSFQCSPIRFIWEMRRILFGRPTAASVTEETLASRIFMRGIDSMIDYTVDGELFEEESLEILAGKPIDVVLP